MSRGLMVWPAVCALFLVLDGLGLAEDLALSVPLILALVGARAYAEAHRGQRWQALAGGIAMGLAGGSLVWELGPGLVESFPPRAVAAALCLALLASLLVPRGVRGVVLRPLGLDPHSPVHVVTAVAMVVTLASSVVLFLELRDEAGASTPFYALDSLVAVVGDMALALAGVGFLLTRDLRATAARLDLRSVHVRHAAWAVLAAVVLHLVVGGLEWVESVYLPALYALEDRFPYEFVGVSPLVGALMVSVAAGVGEEVLFRGALQPRVGIVLSAMLFAALHVQYQLPGIFMILVVGLVLGALKERTSTTFTILVHVLYDLGAFVLDLI